MMKYTDRFFKIPVRIYDRFSIEQAEELEKMNQIPNEGDWVVGWLRIPHTEITNWMDYFDSEQGVQGAVTDGFSTTAVFTKSDGIYLAALPIKEFEEKLNQYAKTQTLKYKLKRFFRII